MQKVHFFRSAEVWFDVSCRASSESKCWKGEAWSMSKKEADSSRLTERVADLPCSFLQLFVLPRAVTAGRLQG